MQADPWDDFIDPPEDMELAGAGGYDAETQEMAARLANEAEALGIDVDTLKEQFFNNSDTEWTNSEYNQRLTQAFQEAIAEARRVAEERDAGPTGQGQQGGSQIGADQAGAGSDRADGSDQEVQAEGLTPDIESAKDAASYLKDVVYSLCNLGLSDKAQVSLSSPLGKSGRDNLLMKAFGLTRDQAHSINNGLDARRPNKLREVDMQDALQMFPDLRDMIEEARQKYPAQPDPLTLTSETEADAQAKAKRESDALAADRKAKEAEQSRLAKQASDKESKARADATVDDFQLGQAADQQLSGQRDIFSEPAQEPTATADAKTGAAPSRPEALIAARKRLSVLESLRKCIG